MGLIAAAGLRGGPCGIRTLALIGQGSSADSLFLLLLDMAIAGLIGMLLLGRVSEPRTLWLLRGYLFLVALSWSVQRYLPLPLTGKLIDALVLACSLA